MSQTQTQFEDFSIKTFIDFNMVPQTACEDETISLFPYDHECAQLPGFVDSIYWDFGDMTNSKAILPQHIYGNPGQYNIYMIVYKQGNCIDTISKDVIMKPNPMVDIGNDTLVEACSAISLDAGNTGAIYEWSKGENTQQILIDNINTDTGISVSVDLNSCHSSDSIKIEIIKPLLDIYFPNAFTPNEDGLNDEFMVVGTSDDVTDFHLQIYDRWGQLIFEPNSPSKSWDGTFNGKSSEMGSYVYKVNYTSGNTCLGTQNHYQTKSFTLLK